ncbi:NADH-quinone oxidoreductase subunit C [Roseibium aggregatum]|uniref:Hydrogenase expression protein HypE n=1 Tax=Roseibium aggregatum TaxID=187304 RepID=A0A926S506_9HYPH|nr:NADH-quinone oxidoreductase subunit C [Roseibium aggregatum]MBD1544942.1 hydrogenase expression protein HypE [Roseibium aggregatum]
MTVFWTSILKPTEAGTEHAWQSHEVDEAEWTQVAEALGGETAVLLGLWGDTGTIRMAVLDEATNEIAVLALACPNGSYPSVGQHHAAAQRLERAARDLFGLTPRDCPDERPWLDHGRWSLRRPLGAATPDAGEGDAYGFLPVEGEGLHQVPVGPVHAGIIEPGHFRFTGNGEAVVRLEERLGYVHKGIEGLMAGKNLGEAARLAARTSGDSTVAYGLALARAAEDALGADVPERAVWQRALMAELERLANHLGDFGAVCNDAAFALMHAHCGVLRERVLRASDAAFGHRLMRDLIVPGGVAVDLSGEGIAAIQSMLAEIRQRFPALVNLYDNTASLQDRTVSTGRLDPALAKRFGAGGFVGRASGRSFDARHALGYPPYDRLSFEVPVLDAGDVDARVWIRIREAEQSLSLIEQILSKMPQGAVFTELKAVSSPCDGLALVEGFRGDILVWLRIGSDGLIERCHMRDPSWFQWPLLEAVIEGNIIADFPLCNKSFNCSYSGHDL